MPTRDDLSPEQRDFLHQVALAMQHARREQGYRILASTGTAQVLWESAWGKHAPGNNYLGIKASHGWTGPVVNFRTHEVVGGSCVATSAAFRAYDSLEACCLDYGHLLASVSYYARALAILDGAGGDPDATVTYLGAQMSAREAYTHDIARVYATDPVYARGILGLMRDLELGGFDQPSGAQ